MPQEKPPIEQKTLTKEKINVSQKIILGVGLLFIFGILAGFAWLFSTKIKDLTSDLSKERDARQLAEKAKVYSGVTISESDNQVTCQGVPKKAHTITVSKAVPEGATKEDKDEILDETVQATTDLLRSDDFKNRFPNQDSNVMIAKLNTQVFKDWVMGRITDKEAEKLDWCNGDENGGGCTPIGLGSCSGGGGGYCISGNANVNWNACFPKGTKISLADGSYLNVEDIKAGTIVKAYDLKSNKTAASSVVRTFQSKSDGYLVINNKLRLTQSHPLFIDNKWVKAKDAKVGDYLFTETGKKIKIQDIQYVNEPLDVYNFEVADYSNYFAEGYLVHNKKWGVGPITGISITLTIHF